MSKLENLVPDLELCKRIPKGAFADSALVWNTTICDEETGEISGIHKRDECDSWMKKNQIPAPTLQEILAEFKPPKFYGVQMVKLRSALWQVIVQRDIFISHQVTKTACYGEDYSPVVAALKLWLVLNDQKRNG